MGVVYPHTKEIIAMSKCIESFAVESRRFNPFYEGGHGSFSSEQDYADMYDYSVSESDAFYLEQAKQLDWSSFPSKGCEFNWKHSQGAIFHRFFSDGTLNVSVNCLDRHIHAGLGGRVAYFWEGDSCEEQETWTYQRLYDEVNRLANVLKKLGVKKGDRVGIYLPMIPQAVAAMLACARIGAVHSLVFGGFSAESLKDRLEDSQCSLLISADYGLRAGKKIELLEAARSAVDACHFVKSLLVVSRGTEACDLRACGEYSYEAELESVDAFCQPTVMSAEDPLFILYTSGSTGKPKGLVHTQAGYLLHALITHRHIFDLRQSDVFWCTADVGWVTGHSYGVYGPLANACSSVLFEGVPNYPQSDRIWQIIQRYSVSILYTAPTLIRSLMKEGDFWLEQCDLSTLRILGSVGEPINPEAWMWFYQKVGKKSAVLVDTWWQTETGGILLSHLPGTHCLKPGTAGKAFLGVCPKIMHEEESGSVQGGDLCLSHPCLGMARSIWGDHQRFEESYFSKYEGMYCTGDGAYLDRDDDFTLLGRTDDVVNVSGHRLGTAEIESALVAYFKVVEAAVVAVSHPIKGQCLHAFVTLMPDVSEDDLVNELNTHIRQEIGAIAVPEKVCVLVDLPKTRSGKIMRRLLRKMARGEKGDWGDLSTLVNPDVLLKT